MNKALEEKIAALAAELEPATTACRRDLHQYPETGWTEFRTASVVIKTLRELGYEVSFGNEVIDESHMMGVPDCDTLEQQMQRAVAQGADAALVEKMRGGKTGVVGIMRFNKPGKTTALRFDMDCNDVTEAADAKHRPYREGFMSENHGCMHACGHDGHTAAGLTVAKIIAAVKTDLCGTVKLIFQPAEEGVRGAKAMTYKGIVDDVDYLLGAHLMNQPTGHLSYDVHGFLATSKFDAHFTGVPAHAGASPEAGKNSLLAAATAALNIQAISRHSDGISRVNVGVLNAGTGRNVIPAEALIKVETRGATSEINEYIYNRAEKIINSAASMYDNNVKIIHTGGSLSGSNSPDLSAHIKATAARLGIFNSLSVEKNVGGSEDCAYFMSRVQQNGGQAAYLIIGASTTAVNHNLYFDFNEHALTLEAQLLATLTAELLAK